RIGDRLLHRDMVPGGAGGVKAHGAAVDDLGGVELRHAMHLRAEPELGVFIGAHDAGLGLKERLSDFLGVVADRRHDAHSGDDDASHDVPPRPGALFLWRTAKRERERRAKSKLSAARHSLFAVLSLTLLRGRRANPWPRKYASRRRPSSRLQCRARACPS